MLALPILFNSHYPLAFQPLIITHHGETLVGVNVASERVRLNSVRSSQDSEDIFAAVRRKEYELQKVKQQHQRTTDPVQMAMGYAEQSIPKLRVAKALRRVYDDEENPANPNAKQPTQEELDRQEKMKEIGMQQVGMRRGSFIVDIKRKSLSQPGNQYCNFDDAGMVAEAMVQLGADAVFINVDYKAYGGDMTELKSAVKAVRKISDKAAVIMKDIIVDEIQLGLAKEAGADGVVLMASVLGPSLSNFLDLATIIGLEAIVECHTKNEVERAIELVAQNIMVTNYDRVTCQHFHKQAIQLAGLFPGSGGPIISIAGGGIETTEQMKRLLAVGYDGVVVGKAAMGSTRAPEFIRAVRDRTLLPAELSQWGIDAEFDPDGNVMPGPRDVIGQDDPSAYR
jgi:indole-3-glycerol phosphate synthase